MSFLLTESIHAICIYLCVVCTYYIVDAQNSFKVEVSYYEIYNEKIHDLLASTKQKSRVNVRRKISGERVSVCLCMCEGEGEAMKNCCVCVC